MWKKLNLSILGRGSWGGFGDEFGELAFKVAGAAFALGAEYGEEGPDADESGDGD
jgi:hypothetical protein